VTMSLQAKTSFRSFEESTAKDWALIRSSGNIAASLLADRVLEQLSYLRNDFSGFPVDRLEHSLQTATRAQRDGRDDEYLLCALLHDIGDTLSPRNHSAIGAAIVAPYVSPANHWLVEHHGVFQGYYFWHHLGGDRNARDAFLDSPYFEYTAEFCAKYDQTAFDVDYRSEPLEHFEPLVRELLGRN